MEETGSPLFEAIQEHIPPLGLLVTSIFVVWFGSKRSLSTDNLLNENTDLKEGLTFKGATVLLFPVVASITLLLYFYLWKFISIFVTVSVIFMAIVSISYLFEPLSNYLFRDRLLFRNSSCGDVTIWNIILLFGSIGVVLLWLTTNNWVFNDIMGVATCVLFIGFIRVPNLKLLVYLLIGLFFYDIFWVFYSSHFFGKNVMETVATQKAPNPISNVISSAPEKLNLPNAITICGYYSCNSLGLGDMALPGIFISYIYRHQSYRGNGHQLFNIALIGYGVGMVLAFVFLTYFRVSQPALLYLVPCSILPVLAVGFRKGELSSLWHGANIPVEEKNREV